MKEWEGERNVLHNFPKVEQPATTNVMGEGMGGYILGLLIKSFPQQQTK